MLFLVLAVLFSLAKTKQKDEYDSTETDELTYLPEVNTTIDNRGLLRQLLGVEIALEKNDAITLASPVAAILPLGKLIIGVKKYTEYERNLLYAMGLKSRSEVSPMFKNMINGLQTCKGGNLSVISRVYLGRDKREMEKKFKDISQKMFGSSVQLLDLTNTTMAAQILSSWTFDHTGKKLQDAVEKSDLEGANGKSLILINAVYFRGVWKNIFHLSSMAKFTMLTGETSNKVMIKARGLFNLGTSEELSAQMIEIPYISDDAALIVILPLTTTGLPFLLRTLKSAPDLLNSALKNMKQVDVDVTLPKFEYGAAVDLNIYYKKMGLDKLQIQYIIRKETLYISRAKQLLYFKVDSEAGRIKETNFTEAIIQTERQGSETKTFNADHPFLFYVKVKYDQLFSGVVYNP